MLTTYEELVLLSIHDLKGTYIRSVDEKLKPGLGGAILAELALVGKIQSSANHRLQLIDDSPAEENLMNEVLVALKESEKEHKFGYWVAALSQSSDKLRKQVVEGLIQKNIVTQEEDRLHWVIPSPLNPEVKGSSKYVIIERLRHAALASEDNDPRDIVLLNLVKACGLLDQIFFRDERKLAGRSMSEQLFNQALRDPVLQTIQEIEAVVAEMVEDD